MDDLVAKALRTLSRLKEGKDLAPEDFEFLIPMTESFVAKRSAGERIRFQHVFGGYVIGNTLVSESLGLKYAQYLVQKGSVPRPHRRGGVSCLHLTSGSPLPPGASSAEGKESEDMAVIIYDDDHMEDLGEVVVNVSDAGGVFDPYDSTTDQPLGLLMDGKYLRAVRHRIQGLRDRGDDSDELAYLERHIATNTFQGRSKQHVNEKEKARRTRHLVYWHCH